MSKKISKKATEAKQKKVSEKKPNYKNMVIGCLFLVLIIILFYGVFYMSNKINLTSNNKQQINSTVIKNDKPDTLNVSNVEENADTDDDNEYEYFKLKQKEIDKLPILNNGNGKKVYLTFDDGPSANTNTIINILNKYNAKATFFVLGGNLQYRINEIFRISG